MYAELRKRVAESLKQREIREVVYFHCDHFEPWRGFQGDVSERNADDILNFSRVVEGVDYARKLTLFYKCNNYICVDRDRPQVRAEDDEIGFATPTARETEVAQTAMRHIANATGHEIQVHFHHEYFTGNEKYCFSSPATRAFFQERNTRELDGRRFDVSLALTLETIRRETGLPLDKWFFIHGNWALNGSDGDVCTIADEMQRLRRLGCLGDFTFPAGRPHCDPRYVEPVFVRTVVGLKSYDLPEADAAPAFGCHDGEDQGRFFIWSSAIKANGSSIDYYSGEVRKRCDNLAHWLDEIVTKGVVKDGTLFVKTHAHSMYVDYYDGVRHPILPHLYPGVQNLLGALFDGATDADAAVAFETAGEVYRRFVAAPAERASADTEDAPAPVSVRAVDVNDVADTVNDVALDVMRERVGKMGSDGAGSYPYYDALIANRELVQSYEREVAGYLLERTGRGHTVIEIGCGLGTLTATLAGAGRRAFGVEGDRRRAAAFAAIQDAMKQRLPEAHRNARLVVGFFPKELPRDLPDDATLVFTNTVCGMPLEEQRNVIAAAAGFSWTLFDAQRFFAKRENPAQIETLLTMFEEAGFSRPQLALDLGDAGQYYRTARAATPAMGASSDAASA